MPKTFKTDGEEIGSGNNVGLLQLFRRRKAESAKRGMMKALDSSQFSKASQIFIWLALGVVAAFAITNVFNGTVIRPRAFFIALAGFVLFTVGKLSVIIKKKQISFGPKLMAENMANIYRLGYWLMIVGLLATFAPE